MEYLLDNENWDIIISDYSMPQFNGSDALELIQKKNINLPFIVISGTIGDFGSFSLERTKHITGGDGGVLITNNADLAEKARKFSILGFSSLRASRAESKLSKDEVQDPSFERHLFVSPNYSLPEFVLGSPPRFLQSRGMMRLCGGEGRAMASRPLVPRRSLTQNRMTPTSNTLGRFRCSMRRAG